MTDGAGGGDTSFVGLPPVHAACPAPSIVEAGSLALDSGGLGIPPAAAWGGKEAAVAYFHDGVGTVELQRLTQDGQLIGTPITVGAAPAYDVDLGVATDGNVYLVCWTTGDTTTYWNVHCASVSMATNVVTPGFVTTSNAAGGAVAYGPAGFVVAYGDKDVWVQALDSDASPRGAAVQVAPYVAQQPYIVGTPSGYLVGLIGQIFVYRLDATLSPDLGTDLADAWTSYSLTTSGDTPGIEYVSDPDAGIVTGIIDTSSFTIGSGIACPQTPGFTARAAGGVDSFAFTWAAPDHSIAYRAFASDGAALGPPINTPKVASYCPFPYYTTLAVGDGFLIITSASIANVTDVSGLSVFHVACP